MQSAGVVGHSCTVTSCYIIALVQTFRLTLLSSSTIYISAGAFVLCWTPGLVILLLDGLLGKDSHANRYEKYCLVIAECNSLVNPIIYSLRDTEMRRTFKQILCCLCQRGGGQQSDPSHIAIDSPLPDVRRFFISEKLDSFTHSRFFCDQVKAFHLLIWHYI